MPTLPERPMSDFPVSIGTGLALRPLFPPTHPKYKDGEGASGFKEIDPLRYEKHLICVNTLIRNMLSAFQGDVMTLKAADVYYELDSELTVITNLYKDHAKSRSPVFYSRDIAVFRHKYKGLSDSKFRLPSTKKQEHEAHLIKETLLAALKNRLCIPFERTPVGGAGLVLTHHLIDLHIYNKFTSLNLLESHTAKLSDRSGWSRKYAKFGEKDLSGLPFSTPLHWLFGDQVVIKPEKSNMRDMVLGVAQKYQWTSVTTAEKILHDVRRLDDNSVINFFLSIR